MSVLDEREAIVSGLQGKSLVSLLADNVRDHAQEPALSWPVDDGWASTTWAGYGEMVSRCGLALRAAGARP